MAVGAKYERVLGRIEPPTDWCDGLRFWMFATALYSIKRGQVENPPTEFPKYGDKAHSLSLFYVEINQRRMFK